MGKAFDRAGLACAALFALAPAAATAGGLALAPLVGAAGIAGADPRLWRKVAAKHLISLILFCTFMGWALLSSAWTTYRDHRQALRLAGVILTGLPFFVASGQSPSTRRLAAAAGVAAVIVLIALLALEALGDMPLNRAAQPHKEAWALMSNPGRGAAVLGVLVWGALGALLARGGLARWTLAAAILVCVGALADQFQMQANVVAFGLGLISFAAGFLLRRWAVFGVALVWAGWLLGAPFIAPLLAQQTRLVDELPRTWAIRAEMWDFASARIMERPWIGRGLNSARSFTDTIMVRGQSVPAVSLHPHSASLQIWLETGAVGALLAAAALLAGAWAMGRALAHHRAASAAACGTLTSFALSANVSFGVWQEWWISTAFVAAALVAAVPRLLLPVRAPIEPS